MNRKYPEFKEGDRFGFMELTGEFELRKENNRNKKYYKVWCNHCHNYRWVRQDMIRHQKSCGCLSKGFRAKYLYLKTKHKA